MAGVADQALGVHGEIFSDVIEPRCVQFECSHRADVAGA